MRDSDGDPRHPALRPARAEPASAGGQDGLVLVDPLGLSEPTFVPAPLVPIVARFDGSRPAAAIAALAGAELGARIPTAAVDALATQLDERLWLLNDRFREARDRELARWLDAGARECRHAGSAGYPAAPDDLRAALAAMVPAAAPAAGTPDLRGLVAPHIDLARGQAGYGAAYGRLLQGPPAELYVVFGTGHQGPGAPVTGLPLDWCTPLGTVASDRDYIADVHSVLGPADPGDLLLHRDEHSIEFQVLMLQHLAERRGGRPFAVAGFLCGALPSRCGDPLQEPWWQTLAAAFAHAGRRRGVRVCYVAGADLAHLGPQFGDDAPIDAAQLQRLHRDERQRLALLEDGRPGEFHAAVARHGNPDRVCSAAAITLVAQLAGGPAELLHYGQAAAEDGSQVVSFCSLAFPARNAR
jgi:AmmeMemoRadiSam system protein B